MFSRLDGRSFVQNSLWCECFPRKINLWINAIANRIPTTSSKDLSRIYKKLKGLPRTDKEVISQIFCHESLGDSSHGSKAVVSFNQKFWFRRSNDALKKLGMKKRNQYGFQSSGRNDCGKARRKKELIYYCVDEYTAFTGVSDGLKEIEEDLFRKSDLVIVRHNLYWNRRKNLMIKLFDSAALDFKIFAKSWWIKNSWWNANLPKPIIGFHGLLIGFGFWTFRKNCRTFQTRFSCFNRKELRLMANKS